MKKSILYSTISLIAWCQLNAQQPMPKGINLLPMEASEQRNVAPPQSHLNEKLKAAWFEPSSTYDVPLYDKVEWGIELPPAIQTAIDNWISNDQKGTALVPAINPFDPDQIDVYAEVIQPDARGYQPVYGFYFKQYERIWEENNPNNLPEMDDPDNWLRKEISSEYDFRFRWSPTQQGIHSIIIKMKVADMGEWESETFNFKAVWNNSNQSFLSLSKNKKYFETSDGKAFFPVGENIFPQQAACIHVIQPSFFDNNTLDCELCYPEGNNSLLCGLDEFSERSPLDWRGSFWRVANPDMQRNTEHIATYLVQLQYMEAFKNAGANCFRTMATGSSYDFEFEKLNNYYDRLFMAWELDEMFEKAHKIDLRVEYCMTVHFPFGNTYSEHWDWTNFEDPKSWYYQNAPFIGNAYFEESDKTNCDSEPISFFREENAKRYYKKKLRYFIARYGWCAEIIDLELVSEINNTGTRHGGWNWLNEQLGTEESYSSSLQSRAIIGQWQIEMADYIKNTLQHNRHLIAADYTGQPMWAPDQNGTTPKCGDLVFDYAWNSDLIDIIAFSSYDFAFDRWQKFSDPNSGGRYSWSNMQCQTNPTNSYAEVSKLALHAEQGCGIIAEDISSIEKDMWCNAFSGFATSGMYWGPMYPRSYWTKYGMVAKFMHEEVFPLEGITDTQTWTTGYYLQEEGIGNFGTAKVELIYMQNTALDNEKAVGIMINRTWNLATSTTIPQRFGNPENGQRYDTLAYENYTSKTKELENVGLGKFDNFFSGEGRPIKIGDMGGCNMFLLKYYDPYTLEVIHETIVNTSIGGNDLKLKDHPTLVFERPYILFKVERIGDCMPFSKRNFLEKK